MPAPAARRLADALRTVTSEDACRFPWQLILSIAYHESSLWTTSVNHKTKDYGLMQISKANVKRLQLDQDRLLRDELYSMRAACKILAYNQQTFAARFDYWLGFYRSGIAHWREEIRNNAMAYDRMIRRTAARIGYDKSSRAISGVKKAYAKSFN